MATLVEGAKALGVPIVVTEQYPRGLGVTVPEVAEHCRRATSRSRSSPSRPPQADGFDLGGRDQALICGIESHVCVSQTAHDLLDQGVEVHVARDAVSSRTKENYELGLTKMESSGAIMTTVEMALFELLGAAGSDEFKAVQRLVK